MKREWKTGTENDYYVRTCAWSPPGCHPVGCGLRLHVRDGKLVGVEGDEEHPISQGRLCVRCLSLKDIVHHPQRILYPMKRNPEDRGKNTWQRITWDEALDIIEEKTNEIKAKYGAESIILFSGTGREAVLYSYPLCFAALGSPNSCFALSGYSCYGPRCAIADFILGAGYPEVDFAGYFPDRYDHPGYNVPEYIVVWGKAPLMSNPDGFFGHSIIDMMKRGSKVISVDPRVNWLATRAAYHIQLRPGTDAAVALGMMNVIINEDLYDHEFVDEWCYGFDDLKERVQEYPPEKVEEITWVPADLLVEATRAFAKAGNSAILWGLAIDENSNGVQAGQGILDIIALTGNLDVPGGLTIGPKSSLMGKWRIDTRKEIPEELYNKRLGYKEYPGYSAVQAHPQPDVVLDVLESGDPYQLKMAWYQSSNLISPTCTAVPDRWCAALKKMEFAVVQDLFMTPTAMALADIFLPLASFAEHDGVVITHFGRNTNAVGAMNKALTVGDCKSDLEICFAVGKRLNPKAWPWETVEEFFDDQLKPSLGFGLEELRARGVYQPPFEYRKYASGKLRDDGEPGFRTPTGLVELKSTLYENFDEDPLPYFQEPHYSPFSKPELAKEFPLILTTGARKTTSFHSEHRQVDVLRDIDPWPIVEIHPDTAAQYGIVEGNWVCLENPFGKARLKAHLTEIVDPRVVHAQHGWWYPEQEGEEPNLYGNWKSNINTLIPHKAIGKLGFGAPFKSVICKLYRVDGLDN